MTKNLTFLNDEYVNSSMQVMYLEICLQYTERFWINNINTRILSIRNIHIFRSPQSNDGSPEDSQRLSTIHAPRCVSLVVELSRAPFWLYMNTHLSGYTIHMNKMFLLWHYRHCIILRLAHGLNFNISKPVAQKYGYTCVTYEQTTIIHCFENTRIMTEEKFDMSKSTLWQTDRTWFFVYLFTNVYDCLRQWHQYIIYFQLELTVCSPS